MEDDATCIDCIKAYELSNPFINPDVKRYADHGINTPKSVLQYTTHKVEHPEKKPAHMSRKKRIDLYSQREAINKANLENEIGGRRWETEGAEPGPVKWDEKWFLKKDTDLVERMSKLTMGDKKQEDDRDEDDATKSVRGNKPGSKTVESVAHRVDNGNLTDNHTQKNIEARLNNATVPPLPAKVVHNSRQSADEETFRTVTMVNLPCQM